MAASKPRQLLHSIGQSACCRSARRLLSLASGCWSNLIIGLALSAAVYSNAVKDAFNMLQLQVGMVTSAFLMGCGLAIIPGFCLDCLGPKLTNMIGVGLFAVGSMFTSLTVYLREYHLGNAVHLAFYFFIAGLGASYFHVANTTVNILNFGDTKRGLVLSILDVFYSASALFYAPLFGGLFRSGGGGGARREAPDGQDLWGFTLFISTFGTLAGVANVFCCARVADGDGDGDQQLEERRLQQKQQQEMTAALGWSDYLAYWRSARFHQLLWTFAISGAAANLLLSNTTVVAASLKLESRSLELLLWPALFSVFAHGILGPISDRLRVKGNRSALWLLANVALLVGCLLPAVVANSANYGFLSAAFCLGHLGQTGQIFFFLMLSEEFPACHLGKLAGTGMLVQSALALLLQSIFGSAYDLQAVGNACSGAACYAYSMALTGFLLFMAIAANCCLLVTDLMR